MIIYRWHENSVEFGMCEILKRKFLLGKQFNKQFEIIYLVRSSQNKVRLNTINETSQCPDFLRYVLIIEKSSAKT